MRRNDKGSEENCSNGTTLILFFQTRGFRIYKKKSKTRGENILYAEHYI